MTGNGFSKDEKLDAAEGEKHSQLRAAKNTVLLVMLRIAGPLFGVILVLALSRFLGSEGLGRYTLAYTFLFVCGSIAPLGLNGVIIREGALETRLTKISDEKTEGKGKGKAILPGQVEGLSQALGPQNKPPKLITDAQPSVAAPRWDDNWLEELIAALPFEGNPVEEFDKPGEETNLVGALKNLEKQKIRKRTSEEIWEKLAPEDRNRIFRVL